MTLDLPYYTGLILATGFVLIPIIAIAAWAIVNLDRKKRK
jgi:hypothetical protein